MSDFSPLPEKLWWSSLPGPSKFIKWFCAAVEDGKNILLDDANKILWPEIFREKCELKCTRNGSRALDYFDAADMSESTSPGLALLENYGSDGAIRNGYRETSGKSIEQYLIDHEVLRNTIIWVKNIPEAQTDQWLECANRYDPQNTHGGILIIECPQKLAVGLKTKNCVRLNYAETIQEYDNYAFCFQMLTGSENKATWTEIRYLTAILSKLFSLDVQATIGLIENCKSTALNFSIDDFKRHFSGIDEDDLKRILWQAQLQEIFPIIERGRLYFLKDKYDSILDKLWKERPYLRETPYGELSDISDLEIAGLERWFMYWNNGRYNNPKVPQEDMNIVSTLHSCRNKLAHLDICAPDDVKTVLDWGEKRFPAKA